jgi:predicted DCC family thiol-disulfide oxidoreductase YuxK
MQITKPTLLFNDECAVCRRIGHWVQKSATQGAESSIVVRPIGDDPVALRELAPNLDIWDAYETIHLVMPDGSMKLGGEAVAEVLRRLPSTRWFARMFSFRPFQLMLNLCYVILSDVRPLFGCESCGTPSLWVRPFAAMKRWALAIFRKRPVDAPSRHSTPIAILTHPTRS